ncbi:hypothetical protein SDC9_147430 [bioreactor metagenome]|uniref:Uncharacterized protein n=1 Tax=bioreactor metagenome TaxID=1076179 RepID=A0A645EFP6_9ZZZZ
MKLIEINAMIDLTTKEYCGRYISSENTTLIEKMASKRYFRIENVTITGAGLLRKASVL